eukprot:scpid99504/ scgid1290/ WSCD family member AAEL009094
MNNFDHIKTRNSYCNWSGIQASTCSHMSNHWCYSYLADFEHWSKFFRGMVYRFLDLMKTWALRRHPIHLVFYEDLVANTRTELESVLHFLQLPTNTTLLDCVLKNRKGPFRRKHQVDELGGKAGRARLQPEMVKTMDCALQQVDKFLPGIYWRYARSTTPPNCNS